MEFKSKKPLIKSQIKEEVSFLTPTLKMAQLFSKEPRADADNPEAADAEWIGWAFGVWDECFRDSEGNKFTNIKEPNDLYDISTEDVRELLNEFGEHVFGVESRKKSTKKTGTNRTTHK